jgi:ParB family chromosome partitioning protein
MTDRKPERRNLGRGLSALMADLEAAVPAPSGAAQAQGMAILPIERLRPNPAQPRQSFDPAALEELTESVRERGVLQPLIVRPADETGLHQIVAGERRWRAAQAANLHDVPVVIRDFTDAEVLEVAIVENIQRADLDPVDEAHGIRQLIERFGHAQEEVGRVLGKSRSYVSNMLRLLKLPDEVLEMLRRRQLDAGHARALVTADDPVRLARRVVAEGLSVRDVERLAAVEKGRSPGRARPGRAGVEKDADTLAIESDLSAALRMSVQLRHEPGGEAGILSIRYNTLAELDMLCNALSVARRDTIEN